MFRIVYFSLKIWITILHELETKKKFNYLPEFSALLNCTEKKNVSRDGSLQKNQKTTHKKQTNRKPHQKHFLAEGRKNELSDLVSTFLNRRQRAERRHHLEQCYHRTIDLPPPGVSCKDTALTPARLQANSLTVELLPSSPCITHSMALLIN